MWASSGKRYKPADTFSYDIDRLQREVNRNYARRQRENPASVVRIRVESHTECVHCGSDDVHLDAGGHEYVCCACGAVQTGTHFGDVADFTVHRDRASAPYNTLYHFNEVWAAYLGLGPQIPESEFSVFKRFICETRVSSIRDKDFIIAHDPAPHHKPLDPVKLKRAHVRLICKLVGMPQYAERWVQIKKRWCGSSFENAYPTSAEQNSIRAGFTRVTGSFFKRFYCTGVRHTRKDNLTNNKRCILRRHNLPHYSWIVQNTMHQIDPEMPDRVNASEYFPMQRTSNVRQKLRMTWCWICRDSRWQIKTLL